MPALRRTSLAIAIALLALVVLNYQGARAFAYWYVSPTGSNTNNCQTPDSPCKTIQAAINKAASGDYISVGDGTYSTSSDEVFPITIDKPLVLIGDVWTPPTIDASNSGNTALYVHGNIGVLISFIKITGGRAGIELIGASNNSRVSGEISNCLIWGNKYNGIYNAYSNVSIERTILTLNGEAKLYDAAVRNLNSNPILVNNLIAWNNGHGIHNEAASTTITNNTISWNYGGTGIANLYASNSPTTNNIVTSNGHYGIYADGTSSPTNLYNDVWGNVYGNYNPGATPGPGSISSDPKFVSLLDFHLQCGSPAINAGTNSAPSLPLDDLDGKPRPVGFNVDMGAYEKQMPFCSLYLPLIVK